MTRLSRPLSPQGARTKRWVTWQTSSRREVARRARERCEGCGQKGEPLDFAHLFGRRHIVGEPMASDPALCAGLCRTCHNNVDTGRDAQKLHELRVTALSRYAVVHRLSYDPEADPLDVVRAWEREAAA